MKRKLLIASVLVIVVASLSLGTLAYFTGNTVAHNVITSGNIGITLVEKTKSGDTLVDFPENGISGVMPGTDVSKIVTVENVGSGTAWIRVKVTSQLTAANGQSLPATIAKGDSAIDVMSFAIGENWLKSGDYYYYKEPVPTGSATTALLEVVTFAKEMGNEYQNCTANLIVEAQAVQTANNGTAVLEAAGWPAETQE